MGFDAALPQFEALHAQVVGVSADHAATLENFSKQQNLHHLLLSDFRRQMLPAYGALVTDEKSPIFRYAKRAYFVIDQKGVVRWVKIQENALDLLDPDEVLKALKDSGAGA
jgi:peroxiredoxin Q/BCP